MTVLAPLPFGNSVSGQVQQLRLYALARPILPPRPLLAIGTLAAIAACSNFFRRDLAPSERTRFAGTFSAAGLTVLMVGSASAPEALVQLIPWTAFWLVRVIPLGWDGLLIELISVLLAGQIGIGLWAWILDFHQFHSPGVGARLSGLLESPSVFYPLCIEALFLAIAGRVKSTRQLMQSGAIASAMLSTILTFSRAAWVGVAIGLSTTALAKRRRLAQFCLASFLLLVGAAFIRIDESSHFPFGDRSAAGHVLSMKVAFVDFLSHPIFGKGPHAFEMSAGFSEMLRKSNVPPLEPKSSLLLVAIDYGLPGVGLAIVFLASLLCLSYQTVRSPIAPERIKSLAVALLGTLAALTCSGLVDAPLFSADAGLLPSAVIWLALASMLLRTPFPNSSGRPPSEPRRTAPIDLDPSKPLRGASSVTPPDAHRRARTRRGRRAGR
jgi:hypothetical protein